MEKDILLTFISFSDKKYSPFKSNSLFIKSFILFDISVIRVVELYKLSIVFSINSSVTFSMIKVLFPNFSDKLMTIFLSSSEDFNKFSSNSSFISFTLEMI